jgi:TonB family protein
MFGVLYLLALGGYLATTSTLPSARIAVLVLVSLIVVPSAILLRRNPKRCAEATLSIFGVMGVLSTPFAIKRAMQDSRTAATHPGGHIANEEESRVVYSMMCPGGLLASVGDNVFGSYDWESFLEGLRVADAGDTRSFEGLLLARRVLRLPTNTLLRIREGRAFQSAARRQGAACKVQIVEGDLPNSQIGAEVWVLAAAITKLPAGSRVFDGGSPAEVSHGSIAYADWETLEASRVGEAAGDYSNRLLIVPAAAKVMVLEFRIDGNWIGYKVTDDPDKYLSSVGSPGSVFWIDGKELTPLPSSRIFVSATIPESVLAEKPVEPWMPLHIGLGKGVRAPVPVYTPDPPYTKEARSANLQGEVRLEIAVDARGNAFVLRDMWPLGLGLDESAMETVNTWKFRPALQEDGNPVPVRLFWSVRFRLTPESTNQ